MRLLLVAPQYSPRVSGSARLLQNIVDHLVSKGNTVEVLTFELDGREQCEAFDQSQSYRVHRIRENRTRGLGSIRMFAKLAMMQAPFGKHGERYDVVLTGVAYPSAVLQWLVAKLTRIPYVVYSHGEDVTCVQGTKLLRWLVVHSLANARTVLVNSPFTAGVVNLLGVDQSRIVWAPPVIQPQRFLEASQENADLLRRRLDLGGKSVILTVARRRTRKGHDTVVSALPSLVQRFRDLHYLIVGSGRSIAPSRARATPWRCRTSDRIAIRE